MSDLDHQHYMRQALDLVDERQAEAVLTYCEEHLNELDAGA